MNVRVKISDRNDFFIIKNFIPLFRHYIAEVYNELPNKYGVFSYDSDRTLQELCNRRESWLEKPDELFPFIIFAFDRPVGYVLVSKVPLNAFEKSDYFINALFIVQPARRKGIASISVKKIIDMLNGSWELHTNSTNRNMSTQLFWRSFISEYTNGKFEEFIGNTPDGDEKIIFRFNSKKSSI
ncbi:GNAT family N-acetyltransferase [uncultured Clostridium sp.]|uniref:GNAT family N-acetyltransferase n=1 Tax=uncultured Clostridium sp. TaxID=59620 RepID=UPI0028EE7EA8|nr:GNAT family N-acetyltransferase [uncultured Clostridium sp.]